MTGRPQHRNDHVSKDQLLDWLEFFLRVVDAPWEWLRLVWSAIRPARASLAAVVLVGIALTALDQGQDMLIALAEGLGRFGGLSWLTFIAGSLWFAWSCWYWARVTVSMHGAGGEIARVAGLRRQIPRLLGLGAIVLLSAGALRAALSIEQEVWPELILPAFGFLAGLTLFALQLYAIREATWDRPCRPALLSHALLLVFLVVSAYVSTLDAGQVRTWILWLLWSFLLGLQLTIVLLDRCQLRRQSVRAHGFLLAGYTLALSWGAPWLVLAIVHGGLLALTWVFPRSRRTFLVYLAALLALVVVSLMLPVAYDAKGNVIRLLLLSLAGAVLAQLFYWTVLMRRWWWKSLPPEPELEIRSIVDFGALRRWTLGTSLAIGVLTFVAGGFCPQQASRFGPLPIALICVASWIAVISSLTMVSRQQTFPILSVIVVIAIIFANVGDNHAVRLLEDSDMKTRERPTVMEASERWLQARLNAEGKGPIFCFIVATAGGGSRAAYWTATVLGRIQDKLPTFQDHLLAISSVSGGSVGAATFRALIAEQGSEGKVERLGQKLTGGDHLSPQLLNGLTVDLLARLPIPTSVITLPDRAWALERSQEAQWGQLSRELNDAAPDRFKSSFLSLWRERPWPALLMNAASVESGRRMIVSNLALQAKSGPSLFDDAQDVLAELGADLRVSTAADITNRFPYVSPPATLMRPGERGSQTERPERRLIGHAVDGGYFENMGASTALEVLRGLHRTLKKWATDEVPQHHVLAQRVTPVVIQITSDPKLSDRVGEIGLAVGSAENPLRYGLELLAPPRTLLETRGARGVLATAQLRRAVEMSAIEGGPPGCYLHFRMLGSNVNPPLGRILSKNAKRTIKGYIEEKRNALELEKVLMMLAD